MWISTQEERVGANLAEAFASKSFSGETPMENRVFRNGKKYTTLQGHNTPSDGQQIVFPPF